jgi:hypothetical protein
MLRRFGGKDAQASRTLSEKAYELKKAEVEGFVEFLVSPTRQHAVVLITRNRDGQMLVEPELWARKLGSLAYVMVGRTRGQAAPREVTRLKVAEGREFRSA